MDYKIYDTIKYGSYWQDAKLEDGKKPIEWIILDIKEDRMLLLSKNVLENKIFDKKNHENDNKEVTWQNSYLRYWLNNENSLEDSFINNAFNEEEQERIIKIKTYNEQNPTVCMDFGSSTLDKIFILSIDDVLVRYFHSDKERIAYPTKYLEANNLILRMRGVFEQFNGAVLWWLRNPGYDKNHAACVLHNGRIAYCGSRVISERVFVRPAFWLKV